MPLRIRIVLTFIRVVQMFDWEFSETINEFPELPEEESSNWRPSRRFWHLLIAGVLLALVIGGIWLRWRLIDRQQAMREDLTTFIYNEEHIRFAGLEERSKELSVPTSSQEWQAAYRRSFRRRRLDSLEIASIRLDGATALVTLRLDGQEQVRFYRVVNDGWRRAPISSSEWGTGQEMLRTPNGITLTYYPRDRVFARELGRIVPPLFEAVRAWRQQPAVKAIAIEPHELYPAIIATSREGIVLNSPLLLPYTGVLDGSALIRFALAETLMRQADAELPEEYRSPAALPGSGRLFAAAHTVVAMHTVLSNDEQGRLRSHWREQLNGTWVSPFYEPGAGGISAFTPFTPAPAEAAALLTADHIYRLYGAKALRAVVRRLPLSPSWDEVFEITISRPTIALESEVAASARLSDGPRWDRDVTVEQFPLHAQVVDYRRTSEHQLSLTLPGNKALVRAGVTTSRATLVPYGPRFALGCAEVYSCRRIEPAPIRRCYSTTQGDFSHLRVHPGPPTPGVHPTWTANDPHPSPCSSTEKGQRMERTRTTLYANARIHALASAPSIAQAMLVSDGRIRWIGPADDLGVGAADTEVRLDGAVVLPGLIDAHTHFLAYALQKGRVDLRDAPSEAAAVRRVVQYARTHPERVWIEGFGWNEHLWPDGRLPSRASLDEALPNRPVALSRIDGHLLWVNSMALRIASISPDTPEPPGGALDRDAAGRLTGILRETARTLIFDAIEPPTMAERLAALREAQAEAHAFGLTGVHTMEDDDSLEALQELRDQGSLRLRVLFLPPIDVRKSLRAVGLQPGAGDEWLRLGQLKLFADGSLGSRTAWMLEPYEDDLNNTGIPTHAPEELEALIREAHELGWPVAVHAIGDAAVRTTLDALERVPRATSRLPDRIEHVQVLHPNDVVRFAEGGIVASMQPIHMASDWPLASRFWGKRARWSYAWRTLAGSGAELAFGSDAPIESLNPWPNLQVAVTRRDLDGRPREGWYSEEALPLGTALAGFTRGAAVAAGEPGGGRLVPGARADCIILARDIFEQDPHALNELRPIATIVGGHVVYGELP